MTWTLSTILLIFSLAGTARIGLFVLNRAVFGQKTEGDQMKWAMIIIPPVLLVLTFLDYPLLMALRTGSFDILASAGGVWILITAAIGIYWIADRAWRNLHRQPVPHVHTLPSELIRLRKAHIPLRFLRKLGLHNDLYDLEITTHEIRVPDLPPEFERYHIAFMTDTHVAGFMRRSFYKECVAQINARNVDLVLLGGDFVTWKQHIPLMADLLLTDLRAKDGCYAVLGNHDYWADADGVVAAMTVKGVRFIINRSVELRRGDAVIDLLGIDEIYRGRPDVEAAFSRVKGNRPTLALSHHPDIVDFISRRRVDLLVCGHTHGGQIRLPFFGAIVVPSKHEGRYAAGFFQQDSLLMYVSRGLGSVPPIRILCPPELAIFILTAHEPTHGRPSIHKEA